MVIVLLVLSLMTQVGGSLLLLEDKIAELEKKYTDGAWYSLHVAAAAACRGSTPSGGSGPHFNVVLPKQNTASCSEQCRRTDYKNCDADVAIQGGWGKAQSYTEIVGQFYNYGCHGAGNTAKIFDEVQAHQNEVYMMDPNVQVRPGGARYYRFCCCRY
jgi:hypothetical protein